MNIGFESPGRNPLEAYVNTRGGVTILEAKDYDEDAAVFIERERLPLVITWLSDLLAELDASLYDAEDPAEAEV